MHTVGRQETEKSLTLYDSSPKDESKKIDEGKPLPRPRRKKASKALKMVSQSIGRSMSLEKLEAKDVLGRHIGVRNGFRGIIVAEALIGLDACQDVLNEMREVVHSEPDIDRKIRAARATGELVGQMSGLIGQASQLQKDINEEMAPKKGRLSAPPLMNINNYNGTPSPPQGNTQIIEALPPCQDQSLMDIDSSFSQQPNQTDEHHSKEAGSSKLGSPASASPQERQRPLSPSDTAPSEPDNKASHEQPQPSHVVPPWEESDEEF